MFFLGQQKNRTVDGFIVKQLCISKVIQTNEHPFFGDQVTQFFTSTNLEEFVRNYIAHQAGLFYLVDGLFYENEIFVKLLV